MHFVKDFKYINDYRLNITFENGVQKEVDLKSYIGGGIFEPLRNVDYFKRVKFNPDIDTIYWENGADLAPDFLYEIGKSPE